MLSVSCAGVGWGGSLLMKCRGLGLWVLHWGSRGCGDATGRIACCWVLVFCLGWCSLCYRLIVGTLLLRTRWGSRLLIIVVGAVQVLFLDWCAAGWYVGLIFSCDVGESGCKRSGPMGPLWWVAGWSWACVVLGLLGRVVAEFAEWSWSQWVWCVWWRPVGSAELQVESAISWERGSWVMVDVLGCEGGGEVFDNVTNIVFLLRPHNIS